MTNVDKNALKGTAGVFIIFVIIWLSLPTWNSEHSLESVPTHIDTTNRIHIIAEPDRPYKRADLVAVIDEDDANNSMVVKRIIALEGDQITRVNDSIHVNGKAIMLPGQLGPDDIKITDKQWTNLVSQLSDPQNRVPENSAILMDTIAGYNSESSNFDLLAVDQIAGYVKQ